MAVEEEDDSTVDEYARELSAYVATIKMCVADAERERNRRVAQHGRCAVTSPCLAAVKHELPRNLLRLDTARGNDAPSSPRWRPTRATHQPENSMLALERLALLAAESLLVLSAVAMVQVSCNFDLGLVARVARAALAAQLTPVAVCALALLPAVYVAGYHSGGEPQAVAYARASDRAQRFPDESSSYASVTDARASPEECKQAPGVYKAAADDARGFRRNKSRPQMCRSTSASSTISLRRSTSNGQLKDVRRR